MVIRVGDFLAEEDGSAIKFRVEPPTHRLLVANVHSRARPGYPADAEGGREGGREEGREGGRERGRGEREGWFVKEEGRRARGGGEERGMTQKEEGGREEGREGGME